MDRLPHELVEHILRMACTDGGWTGSALSSVSHRMRNATSTMRYHSVSLRGPRQIRAFLAILIHHSQLKHAGTETRNAVRRPSFPIIHVKELFLADSNEPKYEAGKHAVWTKWEDDPAPVPVTGALSRLMAKMKKAKPTPPPRWIEVSIQAEANINNLLSRLAPTLKSLSLHQVMRYTTYIPTPFPALVELTWYRRWPSHFEPSKPISLRQWMPVLQRLHIITRTLSNSVDKDHVMHLLRIRAMHDLPRSLSLVYFSDFPCPTVLLSVLAQSLTNAWASHTNLKITISKRSMETPHIYHTLIHSQLEHVIPGIMTNISADGGLPYWRDATPANNAMAQRTTIVVDHEGYSAHRLHAEWLDRAQGVHRFGEHPIKRCLLWHCCGGDR